MKKTSITILSLVAFLGGLLVFYQSRPTAPKGLTTNPTGEQTGAIQSLESKIDDQASVTVTITPADISAQAKEWKFNIVMDTHSVELDQDMTKIAILVDDQGGEYIPLRWEGPVGGHHREGVLVFEPVKSNLKSLELKILGLADVNRSFVWKF